MNITFAWATGTGWINIVTNGFTLKAYNAGNTATIKYLAIFNPISV